ncbi:hypothetical protein L6164_022622 [Bauhinia variegata]|uniref:Uncharacterized protein n=1 Tax=Bauhinia variegata TaxID=167791 RepID=A0ACB9MFT6_BAUVA|nr:hypothetical protein L6164_022622 [Bauhinia variegata]
MEPRDDLAESSFCRDEKVEAMDLLEECWFFENLLNIKPRMIRCYSDPCPSKGLASQDEGLQDSKGTNHSASKPSCNMIQRAPSMPPCRVKDEEDDKKGSNFTRNTLMRQPSDPVVLLQAARAGESHCAEMRELQNQKSESHSSRRSKLLRTPSLPPSIGREERFQVADSRTGRSPSRPTQIDILPPSQTSKSCSIPRSRSVRNREAESMNTEGIREMRRRFLSQGTTRKSLSDLEYEEVQGFKDLGFSFEKEAISPSVANILPGLQEKKREETDEDKATRRPYLSEAWLVQCCAPSPPPIPNWPSSKSSSKDMKTQIKFWARAVASNVRQEC